MDGRQKHYRQERMGVKFENGVFRYIKASAKVTVFFPVDRKGSPDCSCRQCRYYRPQTRRCGLTGEVSAYPDHYVGRDCPLEMEDEYEDIPIVDGERN